MAGCQLVCSLLGLMVSIFTRCVDRCTRRSRTIVAINKSVRLGALWWQRSTATLVVLRFERMTIRDPFRKSFSVLRAERTPLAALVVIGTVVSDLVWQASGNGFSNRLRLRHQLTVWLTRYFIDEVDFVVVR